MAKPLRTITDTPTRDRQDSDQNMPDGLDREAQQGVHSLGSLDEQTVKPGHTRVDSLSPSEDLSDIVSEQDVDQAPHAAGLGGRRASHGSTTDDDERDRESEAAGRIGPDSPAQGSADENQLIPESPNKKAG
jgi:hypothetical protein